MKYFIVLALLTNFVGAMLQPLTKEELKIANYAIRKMSCLQGICVCPRHYYGCRYFEERLQMEYQLTVQAAIASETDYMRQQIKRD